VFVTPVQKGEYPQKNVPSIRLAQTLRDLGLLVLKFAGKKMIAKLQRNGGCKETNKAGRAEKGRNARKEKGGVSDRQSTPDEDP